MKRHASRTPASSDVKLARGSIVARSASELMSGPASASVSARVRPAIGEPTTTSRSPERARKNTSNAASSTMKSVAPSRRAMAASAAVVARSSVTGTRPPRCEGDGGRA